MSVFSHIVCAARIIGAIRMSVSSTECRHLWQNDSIFDRMPVSDRRTVSLTECQYLWQKYLWQNVGIIENYVGLILILSVKLVLVLMSTERRRRRQNIGVVSRTSVSSAERRCRQQNVVDNRMSTSIPCPNRWLNVVNGRTVSVDSI